MGLLEWLEMNAGKFGGLEPAEQLRWLDQQFAAAGRTPQTEKFYLDIAEIRSVVVGVLGKELSPEVHAAFDRFEADLQRRRRGE